MTDEPRRADAAFALYDATGGPTQAGEGLAEIDDDGVHAGPVRVAFLDADALRAADYRIELDLWPGGRLVLTQLGRRFDTFVSALRQARNQARVAGLLAHGIAGPEVFSGAILDGADPSPADLQVYDTHVTIVPDDADPWQVPLGTLATVGADDDPPSVVLDTDARRVVIGRLGRKRDAFRALVADRLDAQRRLLAGLTGQDGFADGLGVDRSRIRGFDDLVARFTTRDREPCARTLLAAASHDPRLGFVQLLDPDTDASTSPTALPAHWASFLLVPAGPLTVLEVLAGPAAATYVFSGGIDAVNRDLQALHFRRAALALSAGEAEVTATNPHRLALRALAPVQRLRARTAARLIHDETWTAALRTALESAQASP